MRSQLSVGLRGMWRGSFFVCSCLIVHAHTVDLATLFLLVTCPLVARAVNINQCGDRAREARAAAWNATHPFVPPPPLQISYEQCLVECGVG